MPRSQRPKTRPPDQKSQRNDHGTVPFHARDFGTRGGSVPFHAWDFGTQPGPVPFRVVDFVTWDGLIPFHVVDSGTQAGWAPFHAVKFGTGHGWVPSHVRDFGTRAGSVPFRGCSRGHNGESLASDCTRAAEEKRRAPARQYLSTIGQAAWSRNGNQKAECPETKTRNYGTLHRYRGLLPRRDRCRCGVHAPRSRLSFSLGRRQAGGRI